MAKRTIDPDEEQRLDEAKRYLQRRLIELDAIVRERREREARRRQRLRRLTFGLLGR